MATLKYTYSGIGGLKEMMADITAYAEEFVADGQHMLKEVVEDAAKKQQGYIEAAVTMTGLKRASGGMSAETAAIIDPLGLGLPGRVRTGEMRDSITNEVEAHAGGATGRWGWLNGSYQHYFGDQEENYGIGAQGAHSIAQSIVWGRHELQRRIELFVRGTRTTR